MSPPDERGAPRLPMRSAPNAIGHRQEAATQQNEPTTTLRRFPVVTAVGYPPAGRRRKFHTIVPECGFCGGAHVHRGTETAPARGGYRAGCGRGIYWIAALVLPTQRRAAS